MSYQTNLAPESGSPVKSRIVFVMVACLFVWLLAQFGPPVFKYRNQPADSRGGVTRTLSLRKLQYVRDEWLGDVRSAGALLHYLLEAEPERNPAMVASNSSGKPLPDLGNSLSLVPESGNSSASLAGPPLNRPSTNSRSSRAFNALPEGPV
jgi:hypothetical protein